MRRKSRLAIACRDSIIDIMSLHVSVMPLVLYFAGEFQPALLATAGNVQDPSQGGNGHHQAAARVKAIQESLAQATGMEVHWPETGGVAFVGNTERRRLHALRALAAWHEYPDQAEFVLPQDPRDHPSLKKIYRGDQTAYPHLMRHSDNRGFWFPVDYPEPARCNEAGWWLIGSSQALGRELDVISPMVEALPRGADRECLEAAHVLFRRAAAMANEHSLPLIIEGS